MDRRLSRGRGTSLIELLVALALGLGLVAGLLSLFRVHAAVAHRQSQLADLQQALRIARHELNRACRLAGRGGLLDAAVAVRNNVAPGTRIGGAGTAGVVAGTDVLVVRGVFGGPMLEATGAAGLASGSANLILTRLRAAGTVQELEPLAEAAAGGEALLLSGGAGSGRCAVVEVTSLAETKGEHGELLELVVGFRAEGSATADGYRALARGCEPPLPDAPLLVGVLEEQRFYLRRDDRTFGVDASHRLARARFRPGSERVHPGGPRSGVALVDHAVDLQVALGFDSDGDGAILESSGPGRAADEWLYNDPADPVAVADRLGGRPELIRWSLILRSARPSRGHLAPPLGQLEDHEYDRAGPDGDPVSRLFLRGSTGATVRPRSR